MFLATGTYRVERGTGKNSFGDDTDVPAQQWDGIPMAIAEKVRRASGADNFTRERILVGRANPGTDLAEFDRVHCEQSNERFVLTSVNRADGVPVMASDVTFELTRTAPDERPTK